jgi:riboflavin transporter FmnP
MEKTNLFTTKKLCLCAIFCALSYVVSLLEIPIFPQIGQKLDFSFSLMLIAGYMLGPIYAEIIIVAVSLLGWIISSSFGIGQLANFLFANTFIMLPILLYKKRKGIKNVIISLIISSVITILVALPFNRFITFPLYEMFLPLTAEQTFNASWYLIIIFNALKCVANSVITLLLYKKLKNILGFFTE